MACEYCGCSITDCNKSRCGCPNQSTYKVIPLNIDALKVKAASTARRRSVKGHPLLDSVRKARYKLRVLVRDEFKCVQCGATERLTIEHVERPEAWKRVGHRYNNASSYQPKFCVTMCVECHEKKNEEERRGAT